MRDYTRREVRGLGRHVTRLMSGARTFFVVSSGGGVARVLGIETSCDDTGVALLEGRRVLSQRLASQWKLVDQFGGVHPAEARRAHEACFAAGMTQQVLEEANAVPDAVAVTLGPGLAPCLAAGLVEAMRICKLFDIPLIGVNHLQAHALTALLSEEQLQFPFTTLLVSGGHSSLLECTGIGSEDYKVLGRTLDDAVGEAFDKVKKQYSA